MKGFELANPQAKPRLIPVKKRNAAYRYSEPMSKLTGRLLREQQTFRCMTRIYCDHHHGSGAGLCADCEKLMRYAEKRLEKCPYGSAKPTCANCPIHCYKPAQREQARIIMRYAAHDLAPPGAGVQPPVRQAAQRSTPLEAARGQAAERNRAGWQLSSPLAVRATRPGTGTTHALRH